MILTIKIQLIIMKNRLKILSICGSPRQGNSETILKYLKQCFKKHNIKNEIILLRKLNINQCRGCVEYCNSRLSCCQKDDMIKLLNKMKKADGYIFISPNYFKMPTGLFKIFIDRTSIFFTSQLDLSKKRALVFAVGADKVSEINKCLKNITDNFCNTLGIKVVKSKSYHTNSELKGNLNDIFENSHNKDIKKELQTMANDLANSLK
jgi:multimeric flavodoxin WrbA